MKKIQTVFQYALVKAGIYCETVNPGAEWVIAGEGVATRKRDGSACAVIGGVFYARYDAKRGRIPPPHGIPCQPEPDPVTEHWPHWIPVNDDSAYRWHREAFAAEKERMPGSMPDGTYELVGPKVNGNNEKAHSHCLLRHGSEFYPLAPRTFGGLAVFLTEHECEGLVFHHPDGRMAKVTRRGFGLPWPPR